MLLSKQSPCLSHMPPYNLCAIIAAAAYVHTLDRGSLSFPNYSWGWKDLACLMTCNCTHLQD